MSCYINWHLQFDSTDEAIYHENLVHPAMSVAPRRDNILVLGGGDGLAVRELLKYDDIKTITLVDLDPEMTKLARTFPQLVKLNGNSLNNPKVSFTSLPQTQVSGTTRDIVVGNQNSLHQRQAEKVATVSVLNQDAAKYLESCDEKFDVVIIDFPDPNAIELAKLYSSVFYHNLASCMTPDSIFVQQSTSPIHAKEAFLCIGRTMQSCGLITLPYHDNVPSFGEWGWWIGTKRPARSGASPASLTKHFKRRLQGLSSFKKKTRYLTPQLVKASLEFGKGMLNTNQTQVTTFNNSAVFNYYIEGWNNE